MSAAQPALVGQVWEVNLFVVNMISGMGLALGIDYSLFVVSRYREERAAGSARDAAIRTTGATASRAVLFSGLTFATFFTLFVVPAFYNLMARGTGSPNTIARRLQSLRTETTQQPA